MESWCFVHLGTAIATVWDDEETSHLEQGQEVYVNSISDPPIARERSQDRQEGRLPAAWRTPEDEALVLACGDHALEDLALTEQVLLSDVLSDRARPHAVR